MKPLYKSILLIFLALFIGTSLKYFLVLNQLIPFNSDEAVVGLMAKHILSGEAPIFFYGQSYMGSLDAYLISIAFRILGDTVYAIRFVQILLYDAFLLSLWWLIRLFFSDQTIADFAILIAAIPSVLVTTYTTASLGGYGESLVFGNLILGIGFQVIQGPWKRSWIGWVGLGLIGGVAFWTLGIAGVYLAPVAICGLIFFNRKQIPYYLGSFIGFALGCFPWLYALVLQKGAPFNVLFYSSVEKTSFGERVLWSVILGIPGALGLRYPWTSHYGSYPILFFKIALLSGSILFITKEIKEKKINIFKDRRLLLVLFSISFFGILWLSRFGKDPTGRYYLPLYPLIVLSLSLFTWIIFRERRWLGLVVIILIVGINLVDTIRASSLPEKITTQLDTVSRFDNSYDDTLIDFLNENQITRGYTNYWVSYRLAFLSDEKLIFTAKLPYKSDLQYNSIDDRYPLYDEYVAQATKIAYITTTQPILDQKIRNSLIKEGVKWDETSIGFYRIFYNLSDKIIPEKLDVYAMDR